MLNLAATLAVALDAKSIVNDGLAPFVAVGTITGACTALAAFAAKMEAYQRGWSDQRSDAYLAA